MTRIIFCEQQNSWSFSLHILLHSSVPSTD
jgi:hypothetical protein